MATDRQAQLLVVKGPEDGKSIPLVEGKNLYIGRSKDNQLVLVEKNASRDHAWIGGDSNGFYIVDMGSANGTFANEIEVGRKALPLRNLDRITFGGVETSLLFRESQGSIVMPMPRFPQ